MKETKPLLEMKVGDVVEFLSDSQTDKGPCSGKVIERSNGKVVIAHSDEAEEFVLLDLLVDTVIENDDGTLWQMV